MIKRYNEFVFENLNKSKSILKSKLDDYEKLKKFLTDENAMGYMGKYTEFLFNGVPYNELMVLYNNILDLKRKNIRINVDDFDKYESLLDDLNRKKISYKFKAIYNKFPKEQKDLFDLDDIGDIGDEEIREKEEQRRDYTLTISKLYDIEDITPFIKKISRYKYLSDLIESAKRFLEGRSQSFDRESVKNMLDDDVQLVFENDNILIVKTKTWEAIKKVGPDTSWCIVSSQSTFESYTKKKNRTQFVVFDYTKDPFEVDFKIGFTVDINNSVTNAHDILDNYAIREVQELLKLNNVKISDINIVPKFDFRTINKLSSLKEIENALNSSKVEEKEISHLLSILSSKLSRSRSGFEIEKIIGKVFKKLLNQKESEILTIEDVNKFKHCFATENQFNKIKDNLSNDFILLTSKAPRNLFNGAYVNKILKYYKNWDYKLSYDIDYYMCEIDTDKRYVDVILYYASKSRKSNSMLLLMEYCKMVKGETIDISKVKNLIDNTKNQFSKYKHVYYNHFNIKYHFSEKEYSSMEPENIIVEDIILKEPQYSLPRKLSMLKNCNVTINYDKTLFISGVNEHYKIMNNEIVLKVSSKDEIIGQIIKVIKDKLTFKSRKIVFKDDVKFPITFNSVLSSNNKYSRLDPKEVTVVIK